MASVSLLNHRFLGRWFLQIVEMLGLGADRQILDLRCRMGARCKHPIRAGVAFAKCGSSDCGSLTYMRTAWSLGPSCACAGARARETKGEFRRRGRVRDD
jgi:hypothetical protein